MLWKHFQGEKTGQLGSKHVSYLNTANSSAGANGTELTGKEQREEKGYTLETVSGAAGIL